MKKGLILFLFTCFLAGCAQIPAPQNNTWETHQQQLENLNTWSFNGKLAVITAEDRHSFNIHWQQSQDDFHIILTTFLGGTILDMKKTQNMTKIIDHDGHHFQGENTEVLIRQLSGFVLPIEALQQWIKGNPSEADYQLNDSNQLASLSGSDLQNGLWSINYNNYGSTNSIALPRSLQLTHEDIRLKFAISHWKTQ